MQYRDFGNLGYKVSALGYGAMRLPENDNGDVDRDAAVAVIREAVDSGINYVDTAPLYNRNQSEEVVGEALAGGYRERVWLSTKNQRENDDPDDWRRRLEDSLRKLSSRPRAARRMTASSATSSSRSTRRRRIYLKL